jgi:hypothetical protein
VVWRRVEALVDANVLEKHTVSNFNPEDGDNTILRKDGTYRRVYTAPKPRTSAIIPPCRHQVSQYVNLTVTEDFRQQLRFQSLMAATMKMAVL